MPTYRLTDENGTTLEERELDDDPSAIAWRSSHPFESAGVDEGRQLRLEREVDGSWVRLDPLGTSEAN